jgi:hypothetical protein
VSDISIRCNEIRSHRDRPSAHSSLTRDIDGLIGLYRTPDALNPRQEVRLRMSEASRLLRFRCDAQLAQRLDSALGS